MFGSHLSIAGGMENALVQAKNLGMDCVQVFTKNQRQWKVVPLKSRQVDAWFEHMESTGIRLAVSHASYLINLASPDRALRSKAMALYREEILRCDALGIPYLVMHPGAHIKSGEDEGIKRVADALNRLHDKLPDQRVVTCLEVTAGQGTTLGYRFEHLAQIMDQVDAAQRVGVCLDSAHMIAAGYDLTSARGAQATLREADRVFGLRHVKVLHLNDSKVPRGKRVDRHEHIGHGSIALEAFEVLVNHPRFRPIMKILETPKDIAPNGRPWDIVNIQILRALVQTKSRPRTKVKKKS